MGGRALSTAPEKTDTAPRRPDGARAASPAIRLLDALRNGDDLGILAVCSENTVVTAENMRWSCQGRDEILDWLAELRERFPGLTFESHTRHIGFGLVIDEARVQDVEADVPEDAAASAATVEPVDEHGESTEGPAAPTIAGPDHPMWDQPLDDVGTVLELWREHGAPVPEPAPLNMPVRVTVRHDDLQVHEISLSFPAALLKRALGLPVDPLEMSLSEVQSAFIAPVGAGFTTYALDEAGLTSVPSAGTETQAPAESGARRRRRGRVLVPLMLVLVLLVAGGAWWATQTRGGASAAGQPAPSPSVSQSAVPSSAPAVQPVTRSSARATRKPNVTLKSDLAFGFNSSTLSAKAKTAIAAVAAQVRRAGLTGRINVDGYTDNIGSSAYGTLLSTRRAQAVADYLRSQLPHTDVTVVAHGHGEADPVASNATAAGRQANRRVTITLPQP